MILAQGAEGVKKRGPRLRFEDWYRRTNHPFFPLVEALVASGITSGCHVSPPLDCPDNPVIRGQMAKVLATAPTPHWAP